MTKSMALANGNNEKILKTNKNVNFDFSKNMKCGTNFMFN
jgi:hypothetical protein